MLAVNLHLRQYRFMVSESNLEKASYRALFDTFAESEYGRSLDGQPRWNRYRPEHISQEEWVKLIGRDADNLQHMWLTQGITELFLYYDEDNSLKLSDEDKMLLRKAAVMHDWGEAVDINYEIKTDDDLSKEQDNFMSVYDELVDGGDVKQKHILSSIIFNHDSRLGRPLNAIERVGYMHTAHKAYELSKTIEDPILANNLRWLAVGVLSNQTVPLMEYSAEYTPVKKYIESMSPFFDEAFNDLNGTLFTEHSQSKERIDRYNQAKTAWQHGQFGANTVERVTDTNVFSDNPNYETRFIEDYEDLKVKIEACRTLGLKVVLTSGSFDLIHIGHMRYIEKASEHGDVLVVGVDSDEKIRGRKGPDRPIVDQTERTQMISHIRGVTYITLKEPSTVKWELIKAVQPDILIATAETYTPEEVRELEENYCAKVVVLEPQATTSTSARMRELNIKSSRKVLGIVRERLESGVSHEALWEGLE